MRIKRKPLNFETKYLALKKANGRCPYCSDILEVEHEAGAKIAFDHIIPLWRGGADDVSNMIACCRTCNARKHTKTGLEFICEQAGIQASWYAKFNAEDDGFMADLDLEDRPAWASPAWATLCEDADWDGKSDDFALLDELERDDFDDGDFRFPKDEPADEDGDCGSLEEWMAKHEEAFSEQHSDI